MGALPLTYAYAARSTLETAGGHDSLGLAMTEPGTFVDGSVERADLIAAALLLVGYDATERRYFERRLPFGRDVLAARLLLESTA